MNTENGGQDRPHASSPCSRVAPSLPGSCRARDPGRGPRLCLWPLCSDPPSFQPRNLPARSPPPDSVLRTPASGTRAGRGAPVETAPSSSQETARMCVMSRPAPFVIPQPAGGWLRHSWPKAEKRFEDGPISVKRLKGERVRGPSPRRQKLHFPAPSPATSAGRTAVQ